MSIAAKCTCGKTSGFYCVGGEGCHNLIEPHSITSNEAHELLREYWVLLTTKPAFIYPDEHREWFKKLESYIKPLNFNHNE
jgi:hypothetical protein